MFNPPASIWFPDGEELEFIEITNTREISKSIFQEFILPEPVLYTQFPYNSKISPTPLPYTLPQNTSSF